MNEYDFIIIYDGDNVVTDQMLAMLTGTIIDRTFTATTNKVCFMKEQPLTRYMFYEGATTKKEHVL